MALACVVLLLGAIASLSYLAATQAVDPPLLRVNNGDSKNVTCDDPEDPNFVRVCRDIPTMNLDCFIWNCSICFWGNDSCMNFDVGPRSDCPTAVCTLEPKPPSPKRYQKIVVYVVISFLCCIVVGLVSYVIKLSLENRRHRRSQQAARDRFLGAAEQLRNARTQNEATERALRELAAAANVPYPSPTSRPLDELEEIANMPLSNRSSPTGDPVPVPPREVEPPRPNTSRARRLFQSGRRNVQNMYQPLHDRMRTRAQLFRQSVSRRVQFARLREE